MKNLKILRICLFLCALSLQAEAEPFTNCPSRAFLIQDTTAKIYGVNLVTGNYELLSSDLGTSNKINGFGFNFHDNYLYGWGYEWGTLVRIDSDFQAQPLTIIDNPETNFYVGDIAVAENAYYLYKKGNAFGLYKINLDATQSDYLVTQRIVDGSSLNMNIYDLAFHPDNGFAYSVDSNGTLFRINVSEGTQVSLGNVGVTGTFGAVYFDVNGNFYISRNQDGQIFRIEISASNPQADLFAYGPSSSNNDGARCAIAPIVDDSLPPQTDFGDAPDSYGTSLANNGARHGLSDIYLGNTIDAEYDAYVYPLSDEVTSSDEDGIQFITAQEAGLDSLIQVTAQGSGYLNIWVDWDQSGQFDADEQLVYDREINSGTEIFLAEIPVTVVSGNTWARVRFSSTPGVSATGGVADGEVEDYQVTVLNAGYSLLDNTPYFLAFEDNWPEQGDYDFNDVVMRLDSSMIVSSDNRVMQLKLMGELKAMGASFHNGFSIQLDNLENADINEAMIRFEINGLAVDDVLLDPSTDQVVLNISDDLWQHVKPDSSCWFYRTQSGCHSSSFFRFVVHVPFNDGIPLNSFPLAPFNAFIFATPETFHGDLFADNPGRGLEIHLKNKRPTSLVNEAFFATADDASDPDNQFYYQTGSGLPWGIAINVNETDDWFHPLEWVDILKAYPRLAGYATSGGVDNADWYEEINSNLDKTYRY